VIAHSSTGSTMPNRARGSFGRTEEGISGALLGSMLQGNRLTAKASLIGIHKLSSAALSSAASISLRVFKYIIHDLATSHSNFRSPSWSQHDLKPALYASLIACHCVSAVTMSHDIDLSNTPTLLLEHSMIESLCKPYREVRDIAAHFVCSIL